MVKRSVKRSIKNNKLLNFDDLEFRIIRFDKEEDKSVSAFFGCDTNMSCYIDINCFSLPTESKSEVAYKSEEEDFCEAFADYMNKNENTIERNIAIEKFLQIYN